MTRSSRRLSWHALFLLFVTMFTTAGLTQGTLAQTTIKLAISGLSEGKLPIHVAEVQGFLKEAGLSIEFIEFKSGGAAVQAFVGGSADACICAADHVILLRQRGLDVKLLAGLDAQSPNALVALPNTSFSDIKALKGGKIGITSPGSSTDNLVRWALKRAGIDPDSDVQLISVGTGPPMRAAIESGAVNAGMLGNAEILDAKLTGTTFKVVQEFRDIPNAALNVIVRQEWVTRNEAVAKGFAKAIARASVLIQNDLDAAAAGARQIFPNRNVEFNRELAKLGAQRLSKDASISEEAFDNVLDVLRQSEPDVKPVRLSDVNLFPLLTK